MKIGIKSALTAISVAAFFAPVAIAQGNSAQDIENIRDSWIFVFEDSTNAKEVPGLANRAAAASGSQAGHVYTTAIKGFSAKMPKAAAERLVANNPNIAYYEADQVMTAFQRGKKPPKDGGGSDPAQQVPYGTLRVGGPIDGSGKTAWVIDSGVDQDHSDLNVDTARSANFVSGGKNTKDDQNGHGTHVAGTIGALDNNIGSVGVAPGATIVGVRVLDRRGSGTTSGVIAGVDYVAANASPGDVANMSLGGGVSSTLDAAVITASNKGIYFVLAAGNESRDANTSSPARANGDYIWTVSAMDSSDRFASFSNFGNPPVDCAAPGVGVYSTYKDGGYRSLSGTSMAAPHVAGLLLFGPPNYQGQVLNDPDGIADDICHY